MLSQPPHELEPEAEVQSKVRIRRRDLIELAATLLPWLLIVALFSLVPELPRVPGISADAASVAGHFIVYGVFAAIVYWLHMRIWAGPDRHPSDSAFVAAGIASVAGLGFEWSQHLFTSSRSFQAEDVIANAAGAVTVATFLLSIESSNGGLRFLPHGVFAVGAALAVFATVSYLVWDPSLAYEDDHWHAPYRVVICGETQPFFPRSQGALHTFGDGVIHVQPGTSGVVGRDANLAAFFETNGGVLTNTSITLPTGETFRNGDLCPDGSAGVVSTSLFDLEARSRYETSTQPAEFLPRDSQLILIEFSPLPTN